MFFLRSSKWKASIKKLQNNDISIQKFVNANEKKRLYYSTPFFENETGHHHNALRTHSSDIMYFPVFTSVSDLKKHMAAIGCARYIIIKGDLKRALDSLESHPLSEEWGVAIDPFDHNPIEIPPKTRVQPKCLR